MSIDHTRKITRPGAGSAAESFFAKTRAVLVVLSGGASGTEYELMGSEVTLGRGPGVDLCFADNSMSRSHASFALTGDGFTVRDLGSTNGLSVNGSPVDSASLKHGDRIEAGEHTFQYVLEKRSATPKTYVLPQD